MSSGRLSAPSGDSAGPGTATTASGARSSPSSMNAARTPLAASSCRSWQAAGSRVTTRIIGSLTPSFYRLGDTGPAKEGMSRIERHNLNFRTRLKRLQRHTIGYSKSAVMHDAVIKLYVHHSNAGHHHF